MTHTDPLPSPHNDDYVDKFYFPDFSLKPSIDKITLSFIPERYVHSISDLLKANKFKLRSKIPLVKGKFEKKLDFTKDTLTISISYAMRLFAAIRPTILLTIHDPNLEILELFNKFFNYHNVDYRIKQIEIAFDFVTDDLLGLKDFLDNHLFLKYQHSTYPSLMYKDTFTYYTSNHRKATKGTTTYIKDIDGKYIVRLELILNRQILRKTGLKLPLDSIDSMDWSKYFTFKYIDSKNLIKYLKWSQREAIKQTYSRSQLSGKLLEKTIDIWAKTITSYHFMYQVETLKHKEKGIDNYSRFMKEHGYFIFKFIKELEGKSFIPKSNKIYCPGY